MTLLTGARSDAGLVREHNEDAYYLGRQIWAVADGIGGEAAGEIASGIVTDQLRARDTAGPLAPDDLRLLINDINDAILDHTRREPTTTGMGSTISGIASVNLDNVPHWSVFNVGDSRVYRYGDGELKRETVDHNEAAELIETGQLDAAHAVDDPSRFILTRALGTTPPPQADIFLRPQEADETFLICSDGLTSEVTEDAIAATLAAYPDPELAAYQLVELALQNGADDNVTAIIVASHHGINTGPAIVIDGENTIPRSSLQEI